jgi:hypothetical protein
VIHIRYAPELTILTAGTIIENHSEWAQPILGWEEQSNPVLYRAQKALSFLNFCKGECGVYAKTKRIHRVIGRL